MDQIEILEAEATILRHRLQIVLAQIRQLKRENRPKSKRLSVEAREKIGAAQKKKWADYRSKRNK
jgi:septum formation topological specificity factor MinE